MASIGLDQKYQKGSEAMDDAGNKAPLLKAREEHGAKRKISISYGRGLHYRDWSSCHLKNMDH